MRHVYKIYERYRWVRIDESNVRCYIIADSDEEVYECLSKVEFGGDWAEDSGLNRETIIAEKGDDSRPDYGGPLYTYSWEDLDVATEEQIKFLRTVATVLEYQPNISLPE